MDSQCISAGRLAVKRMMDYLVKVPYHNCTTIGDCVPGEHVEMGESDTYGKRS